MSPRIARLVSSKAFFHLQFLMKAFARPRIRALVTLLTFMNSGLANHSVANETAETQPKSSEIEEIIVTAIEPFSLADLPRSISIITAEDIAKSAARSLPELLAREANVVLRSFSGNEKFSSIDIRGSGDTGTSNILTIIDGAKINNPDLSGADFSIISLSQIERIEIVRGANTVRYGSGASHGIINITTKKPEQRFTSSTNIEHGSFNSYAIQHATSVQLDQHSFSISPSYRRSDGYREHNKLLTRDLLLAYRAEFDPRVNLTVKARFHEDDYQLPGPLNRMQLNNGNINRRRSIASSRMFGSTEDNSQFIQLRAAPLNELRIHLNGQHRERSNPFFDNSSIGQRIALKTDSADLLISWFPDYAPIKLDIGSEYINNSYRRSTNTKDRTVISGDTEGLASFTYLEVKLSSTIKLNLGYRIDRSEHQFVVRQLQMDESSPACMVDIQFGVPIFFGCPIVDQIDKQLNDNWNNEAFEFGARWSPKSALKTLSVYTSAAKTFRNPNVDELALTEQANGQSADPLKPQTADRLELGINLANEKTIFSLGAFYFRTENEIIFRSTSSTSSGVNLNFTNPIYRRGIEFDISTAIAPNFNASFNIGYTKARTRNNRRIPLVPDITAAANMNWSVNDSTQIHLATRYNSNRLDGNDTATRQFRRLKGYAISDLKMSFSPKTQRANQWQFRLGINNLFNEKYFLVAYSDSVYPAAERHYYGGISYDL